MQYSGHCLNHDNPGIVWKLCLSSTMLDPDMVISFESATNCKSTKEDLKLRMQTHWLLLISDNAIRSDASRDILKFHGLVCCEQPKCREKRVWNCLKKDKTNSYLPGWRQQIKRKPQESKIPQNQGFCTSLVLKCSLCERDGYRKSAFTSPRLQDVSRNDVMFDVNVRMVLLAHKLGLGYAALKKISKVLGIPGLHLKTYQKHD